MNILILTASTGGGHNTAARALKDTIEKADANVTVSVVDAIAYCGKIFNKFICSGYVFLATKAPRLYGKLYDASDKESKLNSLCNNLNSHEGKKLRTLFEETNPDVIISCHPFITTMLSRLKAKGETDKPVISIITDFAPHRTYFHPEIEAYVTAHGDMIEEIVNYGKVTADKIYPLGIPIYEKFYNKTDINKTAEELGFTKDKPTVLLMAGSFGVSEILNYYKSFMKTDADCQCIVITGKNKKLYDAFEEYINNPEMPHKPTKLLQFVNNVEEYMCFADLVATKPGGLTVSESLACNLPMAIYSSFPGVEEGNAEYLIKQDVAVSLDDDCEKGAQQLAQLVSDFEKLKEMKDNCKAICKPYSALNIFNLAKKLYEKNSIKEETL